MDTRTNYRRLAKLAGSLAENAIELAVLIETDQPHGQYYAAACAELDRTLRRICSLHGGEFVTDDEAPTPIRPSLRVVGEEVQP